MYEDVLKFWFETHSKAWWNKDEVFDREIAAAFGDVHRRARAGELYAWRDNPRGRVAEILVLDQFSRNLFRGRPEAFESDAVALVLAQEAVAIGADSGLVANERAFLYMPFMHSESRLIHEWAVTLFSAPGLETTLGFELKHKAIIDRFGRYPHRNAILGRESTPDELAFLAQPGSSF